MEHVEEGVERPFRAGRFVVEEEEDFLVRRVREPGHGQPAADVAAQLFVIERHLRAGQRVERRRIPFPVAAEPVQRAVELLAAAPGGGGDQHARVPPELRIERRILELEFAHCIQAQLGVLPVVRAGIGIRRAVEHHVIHALTEPVHHEPFRAVEGEAESGVVGGHARQGLEQRREVAAVEAQLSNLGVRDRVRLLARPDFDDRRDRHDINGFCQRPDRQLDLAQIEHLPWIEDQTPPIERFES